MEKLILKKLIKIVRNVLNGYKVVYSYTDDYDEYGPIDYVGCKNGYDCGSWNLDTKIKNSLIKKLYSVLINGITVNKNKYLIDSHFLEKIFNNPKAVIDISSIKILTDKEYNDNILVMEKLNTILKKIEANVDIYNQSLNNNYHKYISFDVKNILTYSPLLFRLSLTSNNFSLRHIIKKTILNLSLEDRNIITTNWCQF
jgi:hypothetical protein